MSTHKEQEPRIKELIPHLFFGEKESEKGKDMFKEWSNSHGKSMYTQNKSDDEIINAFYEYYNSYNTEQPGVPRGDKHGGKKSRKMRKSRKSKRTRGSRKSKRSTRSKR